MELVDLLQQTYCNSMLWICDIFEAIFMYLSLQKRYCLYMLVLNENLRTLAI
jgi:hypothetical protein